MSALAPMVRAPVKAKRTCPKGVIGKGKRKGKCRKRAVTIGPSRPRAGSIIAETKNVKDKYGDSYEIRQTAKGSLYYITKGGKRRYVTNNPKFRDLYGF